MIYITGDTHIPIDIKKLKENFYEEILLKKNDYLIICGDFGGVWAENDTEREEILLWLNQRRYTTLFIDGNHENFDLLNKYEVIEWNGGKIHRIKSSILHLMRGQVYNIDNKKIFTFGGGASADKLDRIIGESWWEEEIPSKKEMKIGLKNLKKNKYKIDYIITHVPPKSIRENFYDNKDEEKFSKYLEKIKKNCEYKMWYFGHIHKDIDIDDKHTLIFNNIININKEI